MSYLQKKQSFLELKLTSKGREKLSKGKLNFKYYGFGDSEINYNDEVVDETNTKILEPKDRNPNIKNFLLKKDGSSLTEIDENQLESDSSKVVISNQAIFRGAHFFNREEKVFRNQAQDTVKSNILISSDNINGTNTLTLTVSDLNGELPEIGDYFYIKLMNVTDPDNQEYDNAKYRVNMFYFNFTGSELISPSPLLKYKIVNVLITPNGNLIDTVTIELDRELPDLTSLPANPQSNFPVIIQSQSIKYYDKEYTSSKWDSGILNFEPGCEISVNDVTNWNHNIYWSEDVIGTGNILNNNYSHDNYGSKEYSGLFNYLSLVSKSTDTEETVCDICEDRVTGKEDIVNTNFSVIHYSNCATTNKYGEFFFINKESGKGVELYLPEIMWYSRNDVQTTIQGGTVLRQFEGMVFENDDTLNFDSNFNLEYYDLIEKIEYSVNDTPIVVGRVYPQLQIIVLLDKEINAALSYKSNRNWTLPPIIPELLSPSSKDGFIKPGETYYFTYELKQNDGTNGYLKNSLPQQKYYKIFNNSISDKDINLKFSNPRYFDYLSENEITLGILPNNYYATDFTILYQKVNNINDRPDPNSWVKYNDYSTTLKNGGNYIIPEILTGESQTVTDFKNGFLMDNFVLNNSDNTPYELDYLDNSALNFGHEEILDGSVDVNIGADIYRTGFYFKIPNGLYNTSTNPTRDSLDDIYVSEVTVLDEDFDQVLICKLNQPIMINNGLDYVLEANYDF